MSPFRKLQIKGFCDSPIALPQFLNEIPVGIMVFNADRKVILINRALEALTGFLPQEAKGIPCCYVLRSNLCMQGCQLKLIGQKSEPVCSEANIINKNRQKIPVPSDFRSDSRPNANLVGFIEIR